MQVIPGVLATTEEDYKSAISKIESSELNADDGWIQIDFADNKFVQNQTIGLDIVEKYPVDISKEAHLMVSDPVDWLELLKKNGFKRVICHFETGEGEKFIDKAKELGLEVGIAINPETTVENIVNLLEKIDLLLIMTINPGFSGQKLIPEVIEKVCLAKKLRDENEFKFKIEVDGGINDENILELIRAGIDYAVMTSFLMRGGNIDENLEKIWEKAYS